MDKDKKVERWMELCELAAKEPDPNRLLKDRGNCPPSGRKTKTPEHSARSTVAEPSPWLSGGSAHDLRRWSQESGTLALGANHALVRDLIELVERELSR